MDINRKSNLFQEVDHAVIRQIAKKHFPAEQVLSIALVSGGLFNTTYKIECGNQAYIIRFSPVNQHLVMGLYFRYGYGACGAVR